jgi:tetratricopeptide (TPR) repeat protein
MLKPRHRAEALAALAGLAFAIVLVVRLALPGMAIAYNNRGFEAKRARHYALAQRRFQRAVALDPDHAVAAYNLAEVYAHIRKPEKAQTWYEHAIAADLDFAPAYGGLGHLYNEQGRHAEAQAVLEAGLAVADTGDTKEAVVARYDLLADLGWAYAAQEQPMLAQHALEDAVALEEPLKGFEDAEPGEVQYRRPLPHYYLAKLYEAQGALEMAEQEWEACLRLLAPGWSGNMAWRLEAQARLEALRE